MKVFGAWFWMFGFALAGCRASSVDQFLGLNDPKSIIGNTGVSFSPSAYSFPSLVYDSQSALTTVSLQNSADVPLFVASISGSNSDFTIVGDTCPRSPASLAAGASCTVQAQFAPQRAGMLTTAITLTYDTVADGTRFVSAVALSGMGVSAFAGAQSITNVSGGALTINWTTVPVANSYWVYNVTSGTPVFLASLAAGTSSYTVIGLNPSTKYSFIVRMVDTSGNNDGNSNVVTATTLSVVPGTLDLAFGSGGVASVDPGGGAVGSYSVAVDSQNRILLSGSDNSGQPVLARLTPAGVADTSFSGAGYIHLSPACQEFNANPTQVAVDSQDRYLLYAPCYNGAGSWYYWFGRLMSDGSYDTSFGTGGQQFFSWGSFSKPTLAFQTDDRMLIANDGGVRRLNVDGSQDTAFGSSGVAGFTYPGTWTFSVGSVYEMSDQQHILVSATLGNSGMGEYRVHRFTLDGQVDTSYATGGVATFGSVATPQATSGGYSVVLSDGSLMIGGSITTGGAAEFSLTHLLADATVDLSFGFNGTVSTTAGTVNDYVNGMILQSTGKIILYGYSNTGSGNADLLMIRYNANGTPDPTFGSLGTGRVFTVLGNGVSFASSLLVTPLNGELLVGAHAANSGTPEFAVLQYWP